MRNAFRALALVLALSFASAVQAAPTTYAIDTVHSNVGFTVRHFFSKVPGTFQKFSGTIVYDPANPTAATVKAEIDATSINTRNEKRDGHGNRSRPPAGKTREELRPIGGGQQRRKEPRHEKDERIEQGQDAQSASGLRDDVGRQPGIADTKALVPQEQRFTVIGSTGGSRLLIFEILRPDPGFFPTRSLPGVPGFI